jgi:hypothetical protein
MVQIEIFAKLVHSITTNQKEYCGLDYRPLLKMGLIKIMINGKPGLSSKGYELALELGLI